MNSATELILYSIYVTAGIIMLMHLYAVIRMHTEGARLKTLFGKPAAEQIPVSYHSEKSPDRVVFCIHGFSASVMEFKYLFEQFRQYGISYHAVPLKGFGEFNAVKLNSVTAQDWIEQVTEEISMLSTKYSRIVLLGHSMGALLVLQAAKIVKPEMIILSAPYLEVKTGHQFLKKVVLNNFLFSVMRLFRPCTIKSGNKSIHKYRSYRFVYDAVPAEAVRALWELTCMYNLKDFSAIPIGLYLGGKDNTIENTEVERRFSAAGMNFTVKTYPELGHNLLEEAAGDEVLTEITGRINPQ